MNRFQTAERKPEGRAGSKGLSASFLSLFLTLPIGMPAAQGLTYPGCDALTASDFRKVPLPAYTASRVTKFVAAPDGRLFLASQSGQITIVDTKTDAVSDAGRISQVGGGIWGLTGIALDPEFPANGHIFLYATRPVATDSSVSSIRRITLNGDKLVPTTEKTLLEWPVQRQGVDHSGGGMAVDPAGNVLVATGDNTYWTQNYASVNEVDMKFNALRSAGNTNDLRGKIIRIKPKPLADADPAPPPGPGSTYDIPEGNLFPPGTAGTRPEIYAMGNRNPFTLTVDPLTGWVFWADVGTQAYSASADKGPAGMDEFNAAPTAGNYGWPMFNGPNLAFNNYNYADSVRGPFFDTLNPINDSRLNTGLQLLPPPRRPLVSYGKDGRNNPWTGFQRGGSVPLAGPVYRYQGSNPSTIKLPPHLDGKWIVADHIAGWFKVISFDPTGRSAVDVQPIFANMTFPVDQLLDLKLGSDGALYILEWANQALSRIEYIGNCLPAAGIAPVHRSAPSNLPGFLAGGRRHLAVPAGWKGFTLFDLRGRQVWSFIRQDIGSPSEAGLPPTLGDQVLRIRWEKGGSGRDAPYFPAP